MSCAAIGLHSYYLERQHNIHGPVHWMNQLMNRAQGAHTLSVKKKTFASSQGQGEENNIKAVVACGTQPTWTNMKKDKTVNSAPKQRLDKNLDDEKRSLTYSKEFLVDYENKVAALERYMKANGSTASLKKSVKDAKSMVEFYKNKVDTVTQEIAALEQYAGESDDVKQPSLDETLRAGSET